MGSIQETEKQDNYFAKNCKINPFFRPKRCKLKKSSGHLCAPFTTQPTQFQPFSMARSLQLLIRRKLNSWTPSSLSVSTDQFSPCNQTVPTVQNPDESILSTPEIVNDLLLEIDISKATGPDGISGQMLKGTAQSIAIPLCKHFNMLISSGSIPQEWRSSNIVPVHKSASKGLASNYRTIIDLHC